MRTQRVVKVAALVSAFGLLAAACGSSKKAADTATTVKPAAATTAAPAAATTVAATATTAAPAAATTAAPAAGGQKNADKIKAIEDSAKTKPLVATGDPVVIGFQNPEGDPAGSFPEYTLATAAAVKRGVLRRERRA